VTWVVVETFNFALEEDPCVAAKAGLKLRKDAINAVARMGRYIRIFM
jgi:hypothetical protein